MIINKKQITDVSNVLKNFEGKDSFVTLGAKDNFIRFNARNTDSSLILKFIKTEEKDTKKVSIKQSFIKKLASQNAEEIEIKINKKTVTSKVNGVGFKTTILDEEINIDIEEEEAGEKIKVKLTKKVFEELKKAKNFIDKQGKRMILKAIHLKLKDGVIFLQATDSMKLYQSTFEEDIEGEFDISIREETVNTLLTLYDLTGNRGFPIHVTENNLFIITKGIYFKSVLNSGNYPDFEKVIENIKDQKTELVLKVDENLLKKLRTIKSSSKELILEKREDKLFFTTKTEVEENTFFVEVEKEGELTKKFSYDLFLDVIQDEKLISFKKTAVAHITEERIVVGMALR